MKAKEAISPRARKGASEGLPHICGELPLLEVLPLLLDSPTRELCVDQEGESLGMIDQSSMLEALGHMITPRDDSSILTVSCTPADYSASHIARAIEDSDVHLVDLFTTPAHEGKLNVTLRVRCSDPTPVAHNLERYGYTVTDMYGDCSREQTAVAERLLALKALMDV